MENDWFYVSGTNEIGPFSIEQVQSLLAGGKIGPDTMVRNRSWMEWHPARECLSGDHSGKRGREPKNLEKEAETKQISKVAADAGMVAPIFGLLLRFVKLVQKLLPPANQAEPAATGEVKSDTFFEFYLSPIELFQIEEVALAEQFDAKTVQREE